MPDAEPSRSGADGHIEHEPTKEQPLSQGSEATAGQAPGAEPDHSGRGAEASGVDVAPELPQTDLIPNEGVVDPSGVMIQLFHWYLPDDGSWWRTSGERAAELAEAGFTAVWLPPAYKGHVGGYDVGYGVYDLYDLGEFEQKGSVRTRYGTKKEYLAAIADLQSAGLAVYADIVWNHRLGGDEAQVVRATPYSAFDRHQVAGLTRDVQVWTKFLFPGRGGVYDSRTLNASHFDAVDHDELQPDEWDTIYLFEGKEFDPDVDEEHGNYSYLMGCDIDHGNEEVRDMLMSWGRWYLDVTGVDGLRMDAVKHMPRWALPIYLDALRAHRGSVPLPVVGEYWSPILPALEHFIDATGGTMALFDVPLHHTFAEAGKLGATFDLRRLFEGSLVANRPELSVTFVDNHDSQPMQALESPIADWFKPAAYATILLRRDGLPCVFVADYDGAAYTEQRWGEEPVDVEMTSFREFIDLCLRLRRDLGDAEQEDHFARHEVIAWVRRTARLTVVVVVANAGATTLEVSTGRPRRRFTEATGAMAGRRVISRADGTAVFPVPGGGVTIWVSRAGRSVARS